MSGTIERVIGRCCAVLALALVVAHPGAIAAQDTYTPPLGVGMISPRIDPSTPFYLFGGPSVGDVSQSVTPVDSVVFKTGAHSVDIAYAPPWFAAANMKLDYDLLLLRAVSMDRNWIQVVVNHAEPLPRMFPRTLWVDRQAVEFRTWPEFLLDVFSVETIEPIANPLRNQPNDEAGVVGNSDGAGWLPIEVRGAWLRVEAIGDPETARRTGWIRWRNDSELLVIYNLLS